MRMQDLGSEASLAGRPAPRRLYVRTGPGGGGGGGGGGEGGVTLKN